MRPAIVLFAKAPVPGRVKTRLIPRLGAEAAAELHRAATADTLLLLERVTAADVELHTDIPTDAWPHPGVARKLQCAGDLQLKLLHAIGAALDEGRPRILIVGADSPTLPPAHLAELLDAGADVSFGPTEDGGYYAIACRRWSPAMFDGVEWSTARTLDQSEAAAGRCALSTFRGRPWYDVDEPADLDRLAADPGLGFHLRSLLTPAWLCRGATP